jgi:hypothetical protein
MKASVPGKRQQRLGPGASDQSFLSLSNLLSTLTDSIRRIEQEKQSWKMWSNPQGIGA